jgi:hypothetical protein
VNTRDAQCTHEGMGWVSWPPIKRPGIDVPNASTYCCGYQRCIQEAQQWVREQTGHEGVFVEFPTKVRAEKKSRDSYYRWRGSALRGRKMDRW